MKTVKGRVIIISGAVLVIAAVILIILLSNSETTYRSISISEVYGKVVTQNNGKSYEAYKNMVISGGYSLSTEKESYTRMVLDGDKYMKLEEESSASFVSLGSPQSKKTAIRLNYGVLSTEITQPLTEDEDFIVNTPNAVLAVRGTFFRVEVSFDTNGDAYTDVYTYAGSIDCHRIMPDGTEVDEHVMINKGYKARIKMDEIITIYVEEFVEEEKDDVDPLEIREVQNGQLVDVYNASAHGHEMFRTTKELWLEILERNIDLSKYNSAYDGGEIPAYTDEDVNTSEPENSDSAEETTKAEETAKVEETSEPPPNTDEEQSGTLPFESAEPPPEAVPNDNGGHSGVPPDETAQPPPVTAESPPQVTPDETTEIPTEVTADPPERPPDETAVSSERPSDETSIVTEETTDSWTETEPIEPEPDLIAIDEVNFPDTVFRTYVSANFDKDSDGYLSVDEREAVTSIDVSGKSSSQDGGVTSLKGVEHFTKLESLRCQYNSGLAELDVSRNTALTHLYCDNTSISELDVSKNTALTDLYFRNTLIDAIDVSNNTALAELSCIGTSISTLDVSKNAELIVLWCSNTSISTLDLSKNTALHYLSFSDTSIKELDLSKNTELILLSCYNSPIANLDVRNNTGLIELQCYNSNLAYIDITNNSAISRFNADRNKHPITIENGDFDISGISGIVPSRIVNGEVTLKSADNTSATVTIDGSGKLSGITKDITEITYTYDCDGKGTNNVVFTLVPDENSTYVFEPVEINTTNFPDAVFRQYVNDNFDTVDDDILSKDECEAATYISVDGESSQDGGVTSLKGVENFTKLEELHCDYNSGLSEIDVSKNVKLDTLNCGNTSISKLNVSNNTLLQYLYCNETSISELNISKNTELKRLECDNTSITELDVSKNKKLIYLYCNDNSISELNVSNNTALEHFGCYNTSIRELDVSKNTKLFSLLCSNTSIGELDVSKNTALRDLSCHDTSISKLDVSNNTALKSLYCNNTSINELDVSKNTALQSLYCSDTSIISLDVSKNTALTRLSCGNTSITELDVSMNTALEYLFFSNTLITELDVSNNTALKSLSCNDGKLAYIDISNHNKITSLKADNNKHPITVTNGIFDTSTITGFDPARVSNVNGADWDASTGTLSNIAEGTAEITYTYDCDGAHRHDVTFALVPDASSSYASNLSIDSLSLDNEGEGLTDIESNSNVDVNAPSSDEETPSDIASEENSENVSEVIKEETEQKGEKIPEPPPDVNDSADSDTDTTLNESTGDEILTKPTGDETLTESTGNEILAEPAGDEDLTESAEDENLTESTADNGGEDLTQSTAESSAENLTENTVNDSAESGSEVITETEPNFTPVTVTQVLTDAA